MLPVRFLALPLWICQTLLLLSFHDTAAQQNRIRINAGQVMNQIPSTIYGSCIEDVNHEIYGGFYSQMIFGESFEEPASGVNYKDWQRNSGYWAADREYGAGSVSIVPGRNTLRSIGGIEIGVEPDDHARLVYDPLIVKNGTYMFDIRFPESKGDMAGAIFRVSGTGIGEHAFTGYRIGVSRDGRQLQLSRHVRGYQLLKEAAIALNTTRWNRIRVSMQDQLIKVWLNNDKEPVIVYEDTNNPLPAGKLGLITSRSPAAFRNTVFISGSDTTQLPLLYTASQQVSDCWDPVSDGHPGAKLTLTQDSAWHGVTAQAIEQAQNKGRAGVANRGLNRWGIAVTAGEQLNGSLWLRGSDVPAQVIVALENSAGTVTYARQVISIKDPSWRKYSFRLTPGSTDAQARWALYIERKGKIYVDAVSLMPEGGRLFNSLPLRADIAHAIRNEKITFMRYGGSMVNAEGYRFKNMIGPREQRPPYTGHWNKFSTNGFGIEEFLQFCEAAGITPAFAINIEETPADVADMMEYLNGAVTTPWGQQRAANGHPRPYGIKYIEIGNEEGIFRGDNANDYTHYAERFNLLHHAIRSKDTAVKLICAAWWRPGSPNMAKVFRGVNGKAAYWDFHPGADNANAGTDTDKELSKMRTLFHEWDPATTMKCVIFEENGNLHNMQRALGHATTLNAVRRHGDFVFASCPANALQPWLQNDNGWDQGQIFFTADKVWGMPPYYAQQMAAGQHLPLRVKETVTGDLDVTATTNGNADTLILHVVNTNAQPAPAVVELENFESSQSEVYSLTLAGAPQAENGPGIADIAPVQGATSLTAGQLNYTFPAHAYTILRFTRIKQ